MRIVILLEMAGDGTNVTIESSDIPPGVRAADNEAGRCALEKLARLLGDDERDLAPKLAADAMIPPR